MTHKITLLPDQHRFDNQQQETILESALRSGQSPDYGCNNGNCGQCKAILLEGEIKQNRNFDYQLTAEEKAKSIFLMCCHTACTDLVIEAKTAHDHTDIPLQSTNAKVKKIQKDESGVMLIPLQTPRTGTLRFLAGQSIELLQAAESLGHYYVGSCPCDDRNLLLHIPANTRININSSSCSAEEYFKSGLLLNIEGPHGDFTLEEQDPKPAIMFAEEHAFSPIKSLIEHAIALEYSEAITLTRFSQFAKPYLHNLCRSWNDALDDFTYHSIIAPENTQVNLGKLLGTNLPDITAMLEQQAIVYIAGTQNFCDTYDQWFRQLSTEVQLKCAVV